MVDSTRLSGSRLRQVVLAARDLEAAVARLRTALELGEPFSDPAVGYFGLRNAVFALEGGFLEVVSPAHEDTAAGRLLARRGVDCGYMVMVQVADLSAARAQAQRLQVREVFAVDLPDIAEVHLHPADMHGAIVSLSRPEPPESWRWGGPDWAHRSVPIQIDEVTLAVADPDATVARWEEIAGPLETVRFIGDPGELGVTELRLGDVRGARDPLRFGTVTIRCEAITEHAAR